ncbi:MAG: trypsin-like peptidase domain-containing protein [Pseudomonadota bacterium]
MIEPLLLTTPRLCTFAGDRLLSAASSFFFEREGRLYLVTSRHVLYDQASAHLPDRVELTVHVDPDRMALTANVSLPLYQAGRAVWRQACDTGGEVDVAALPLDAGVLPPGAVIERFAPESVAGALEQVEVGTPVLVPAYPLGFFDTVHHLPVVRAGCVASSFGVRFQGQGFFLTDVRTHRGSSGAPVVQRHAGTVQQLPWRLLGVHSSRMDMLDRDAVADESLGLNCAWYADVLLALTDG